MTTHGTNARLVSCLLDEIARLQAKMRTPSVAHRAYTAAAKAAAKTPTVGVLTGVSYVSGVDYYKGINEQFADLSPRGTHMKKNPPMVMVSVDCDEYVTFLENHDSKGVEDYLFNEGVLKLVAAGIEFLVIASNTAHCVSASQWMLN